MLVGDVTEAAVSRAWAKSSSSGPKLKYRCTYGPRKGQMRASAAACMAPMNFNKSQNLKATRRSKSPTMSVKTSRTKRTSGTSKRVARMNAGSRRQKI